MDLERIMMLPKHELALIYMGFDPDKATTKGTDDIPEFVTSEIFGKKNSPMLMFNSGGDIKIREGVDEPGKKSQFGSWPGSLSAFGIYTAGEYSDELNFYIRTIDTGEAPKIDYWFFSEGSNIRMSEAKGFTTFDFAIRGACNYDGTIWPFSSKELPSEVIVPYLPIEERDAKYWGKIVDMNTLDLSEPEENKDGTVSYTALCTNPNVDTLRLSSVPRYSSKLVIEVEFNEPVNSKEFAGFQNIFNGSVILDGEYIGNRDFTGTRIHAEIDKCMNYLATGLIEYISK